MSFKLLYTTERGAQGDFLVSPTLVAEAGMLGTIIGTTSGSPTGLPQVVLTTGTDALIGVIDENKTTQFLATVQNEFVNVTGVASGTSVNLNNANVVPGTFATNTATAWLTSAANGTVSGTTNGTVSYSYIIPGKAGDDTTLASGKCTLWLMEGEYATDVYEVATASSGLQAYTVGAPLYASANSKLTTVVSNLGSGNTLVGFVTKTPSAGNPFLNFYLKQQPSRRAGTF
jgi:hypothetical protein